MGVMGRPGLKFLILHGVISLGLGSLSGQAEAGYLAAGIGGDKVAPFTLESGGSSSSESSSRDRAPLTLADWEHHVAGHSAGGMTSQSVTPTSSGAVPCILVQSNPPAAALLVSWLGPAGRVWLPPAFLSGIFRPPRFVG